MEIKRDYYLNKLIAKKHNGLIKVITGMRRCGKSYLLFTLFKQHLRSSGVAADHIIEIAFDSFESKKLRDPEVLYPHVKAQIADDQMYYILLDEVQLLGEFESVLNGFMRIPNVDVYVTGSNAKFLSKDIITEFRGRGDELHMNPLSFAEFMSVYEGNKYDGWKEYVLYGGLPPVVLLPTPEQKIELLKRLFDETYVNDNYIKETGMSKLMDGVYISGFLTDGDKTELDSLAQELHEKGVPFYVRNLSGVIMQSAFDFADFELIAIAYPVFREFVMNGGYDLAKYFVLRLWNLLAKGHKSKIPFTVTIEGIPTTTGIETIKCKISEPLSKKAQEKVVDKAFELASQIENHQYQLLDRSRYYAALNGHIFNYDAASETLTEINIEEELQKRVQKHNDIYPEGFEKYHFKAAIPARNKYMVDNAAFAICYVTHGWGGAAKTYERAIKKKLNVINLGTYPIKIL